MSPARKHSERLVGLVLAGVLAFNYPLLYLFSDARLLLGIPVLYLYLFVSWAVFIAVAAAITESRTGNEHALERQAPPTPEQ